MKLALAALASVAATALPTHLSAHAWTALRRTDAPTFTPTATGCAALDSGSADEEVRGVAAICTDNVQSGQWSERASTQCVGVAAASGASAAAKAACGEDVGGVDGDLSAIAQWTSWFAGRLGSGGCRSYFVASTNVIRSATASGAPLARDLRANASSSRLLADFARWAAAFKSAGTTLAAQSGTMYLELGDCQPPSS